MPSSSTAFIPCGIESGGVAEASHTPNHRDMATVTCAQANINMERLRSTSALHFGHPHDVRRSLVAPALRKKGQGMKREASHKPKKGPASRRTHVATWRRKERPPQSQSRQPLYRKATKAGQSPAFAKTVGATSAGRRRTSNVRMSDVVPNVLSHRTPGQGDPAPTPDQAGCSSRIRHSRTLDGTTSNCRKDRRKPAHYTCNGQPLAPLPTPSRHHTACRKALPSARRPDGEICSASHKWHMCTNDMREDGIFRTSDCISNIHQA